MMNRRGQMDVVKIVVVMAIVILATYLIINYILIPGTAPIPGQNIPLVP